MGGISNFFNFIKRAYDNHSATLEVFVGNTGLGILNKAGSFFLKFIFVAFFLYIVISYINLAFTLLKTLINFYHLVIDYLNNDLNNPNNLHYNPFLIAFKNVVLPPLIFVVEIVFPIYLFIFKGSVIRGCLFVYYLINQTYMKAIEHVNISSFGGFLERKINNSNKFFPHLKDKDL
ncbi:putative membrane protein [Campylobacter sp. RM5004]|uniref:hypothetical protein n=1 Tax=Campylobacter sp. RM5004 TaxID=1660078 RepID=UPI001EFB6F9E|nr:hypothetical protein [Campylobacter sp. RM5004]ULO01292.1 putative membrane protein [Campylobacter sp. RM5004]